LINTLERLTILFNTITGIQCATSNHPMRHIWHMRHSLATPALDGSIR